MRTTQQFSITLPIDMAEGVRALMERDAAVDRWLREEVVAGHKEYLTDA